MVYNECSVNFSIINACSCRCWFCNSVKDHQSVSEANRLTLEDIQHTFRATPPGEKLKAITISGFGESIMNPECVEIAAFLRRQTEHLSLLSNGVLLTPEISARLIEAGLDEIRLSMTGITPEIWGKYQGCGFGERTAEIFSRVINNVKSLCENRDRINPQCVINTNYMMTDETSDHLPLYLQTMKNLGVNQVMRHPYHSGNRYSSSLRHDVEKGIARKISQGLQLCTHVGNSMIVNIHNHPGEIYCCCFTSDPSLSLGNILEQPLYELLTGEKLSKIYNLLKHGKKDIPQACLNCLYTYPIHIPNLLREEESING